MKFSRLAAAAFFIALSATLVFAQTKLKTTQPAAAPSAKSSPAYAEVLLRRTELLSELESLLVEYTEDYPKVKDLRFESGLLQKEMDRLMAADATRLSAALGKLMVRKCELETDLWTLQKQYNDQHPDVKRARRRVEIFETAIADILQGK